MTKSTKPAQAHKVDTDGARLVKALQPQPPKRSRRLLLQPDELEKLIVEQRKAEYTLRQRRSLYMR